MRSSTSVTHAIGSMPFNFPVWINVMAIDQWNGGPPAIRSTASLNVGSGFVYQLAVRGVGV
jgi:hypothetical protein